VEREKRNARTADYLITVNESIAALLHKRFRLPNPPVVTRNVGHLRLVERNRLLREETRIGDDKKVIVYASSNVHPHNVVLEGLMAQIANDSRYVLLIVAQDNLRRRFVKSYAEERGYRNVFFRDMLPVDQLELYLSGCDIGLITAWDKKNLSYWLALDNKMFTYIMAGLPVLAPAQPEYRRIIDTYGVGVCVNPEKPGAYTEALRTMEEQSDVFRQNAEVARAQLNWENEKQQLLKLYAELGVTG
jgi:glycosyltransferase involved in cell wall biosynthesis